MTIEPTSTWKPFSKKKAAKTHSTFQNCQQPGQRSTWSSAHHSITKDKRKPQSKVHDSLHTNGCSEIPVMPKKLTTRTTLTTATSLIKTSCLKWCCIDQSIIATSVTRSVSASQRQHDSQSLHLPIYDAHAKTCSCAVWHVFRTVD